MEELTRVCRHCRFHALLDRDLLIAYRWVCLIDSGAAFSTAERLSVDGDARRSRHKDILHRWRHLSWHVLPGLHGTLGAALAFLSPMVACVSNDSLAVKLL